jgi:hypothetical protein
MSTVIEQAVLISRQILDGQVQPNYGCYQNSELCQENSWPRELQIFSLLAHEQEGHDHIGLTAENTIPSIIEASRALVANHS